MRAVLELIAMVALTVAISKLAQSVLRRSRRRQQESAFTDEPTEPEVPRRASYVDEHVDTRWN